jgi:hypothetical protein
LSDTPKAHNNDAKDAKAHNKLPLFFKKKMKVIYSFKNFVAIALLVVAQVQSAPLQGEVKLDKAPEKAIGKEASEKEVNRTLITGTPTDGIIPTATAEGKDSEKGNKYSKKQPEILPEKQTGVMPKQTKTTGEDPEKQPEKTKGNKSKPTDTITPTDIDTARVVKFFEHFIVFLKNEENKGNGKDSKNDEKDPKNKNRNKSRNKSKTPEETETVKGNEFGEFDGKAEKHEGTKTTREDPQKTKGNKSKPTDKITPTDIDTAQLAKFFESFIVFLKDEEKKGNGNDSKTKKRNKTKTKNKSKTPKETQTPEETEAAKGNAEKTQTPEENDYYPAN